MDLTSRIVLANGNALAHWGRQAKSVALEARVNTDGALLCLFPESQSARYRKSNALYVEALLQSGHINAVPPSGISGLGGDANGSRINPMVLPMVV